MRRALAFAAVFFLLCSGAASADAISFNFDEVGTLPKPEALRDRFSYVYGFLILNSVLDSYPDLDLEYWAKGMYDTTRGELAFSKEEMRQILSDYQLETIARHTAERKKTADENLAKANAFLAANRNTEGVFETGSGLQYKVVRQGDGERPAPGSNVRIDYRCLLLDGREIDSSYARKVPSDFSLEKIVPGLAEGISLMSVGSRWRFWVPPHLAYGADSSNVEPNSLLVFDVELLAVND